MPNPQDPLERILTVTRWFLTNYYKRPRGLKKPYNPLLGEVYRCMYAMTASGHAPESRIFVVAEQVSLSLCVCL